MAVGELEDVVVVGASEPVDRLGVVADRREVARAGRRDRLDDLDLERVGVLHLVDEDVAEHPALFLQAVRELVQEPQPLGQQVVVVHAVAGELAAGVRAAATFSISGSHSA